MVPEEDDSLLIRRNRRDEEEQGEEMRTFKQGKERKSKADMDSNSLFFFSLSWDR